MAEITELKVNFIIMTDGVEYIRAGTYDMPIKNQDDLDFLVTVANRVRVLFAGRRFL